MYGLLVDVENIVQQLGKAGRNGLQSHYILYARKQPEPGVDPEVRQLLDCYVPRIV